MKRSLHFTRLKRSGQILRGYQRVKLGNSALGINLTRVSRPPLPTVPSAHGSPACMTLLYDIQDLHVNVPPARWRTNFFSATVLSTVIRLRHEPHEIQATYNLGGEEEGDILICEFNINPSVLRHG